MKIPLSISQSHILVDPSQVLLSGGGLHPPARSLVPVVVYSKSTHDRIPLVFLSQLIYAGKVLRGLLLEKPYQSLQVQDLSTISSEIWDRTGVKVLLLDIFQDGRLEPQFIDSIFSGGSPLRVRFILEALARMLLSLRCPDRFMVERSVFPADFDRFLEFIIRDRDVNIHAKVLYEPSPVCDIGLSLSAPQVEAVAAIRRAIRVHRRLISIKGVQPRAHLLLVGMSGVGKNYALSFATRQELLPIFSVTLPSWVVLGGKGNPTLYALERWLLNNPQGGIIHIDEIDKVPLDYRDGNASWFRSVRNEILLLMDGNVDGLFSADAPLHVAALRKCLFVGTGNFQELFRAQVSREAYLDSSRGPESLLFDDMHNQSSIDSEDIRIGKYLPEELINRFSRNIVYLRYPSISEFSNLLSEIDHAFGIGRSDQSVLLHASKLIEDATFYRGVEDYLVELLSREDVNGAT